MHGNCFCLRTVGYVQQFQQRIPPLVPQASPFGPINLVVEFDQSDRHLADATFRESDEGCLVVFAAVQPPRMAVRSRISPAQDQTSTRLKWGSPSDLFNIFDLLLALSEKAL